jgi:demethylmenaquinone methyltransferase/2-methoxy-6-polyprenyl-1,4-benzoquinol methylase
MDPRAAHAADKPPKPLTEPTESFGFRRVSAGDKPRLVGKVFDSVASRYDIMNDFMSGGLHRLWKAELIWRMRPAPGRHLVDVAGGTGDIATAYLAHAAKVAAKVAKKNEAKVGKKSGPNAGPARATIIDINQAMIETGRDRAIDRGQIKGIDWTVGDATALPLNNSVADQYSIAFGIRNVTGIETALTEAYRILKPGGQFYCLEFGPMPRSPLKPLYEFYSFNIVPMIGQIVASDGDAYRYLVESIRRFPNATRFQAMIEEAGFSQVRSRPMSGGIVNLFSAWRL